MLNNIVSDFTTNAAWELIFVIMLTSIARIIRMTLGKKMTTNHEIMFWIGCIICGTIALEVLNVGVIKPIQEKISTTQTPNFHCEIVNGQNLKFADGTSQVVLVMKIINSGSPSGAWKWHLKIELASGQVFETDASENPSVISSVSKEVPIPFPASTYLPNILLETPISNGSGKMGWVGFVIADISADDIERIGNKFTISFQDSDGRVTQASETIVKKVINDFLFGKSKI